MKVEEVHYTLHIASAFVSSLVIPTLCKAVSYLPDEIIEWLSDNILFITPEERSAGAWFPFSHGFFEGRKGFILVSKLFSEKTEIESSFTIAHESAHAFLGHTLRPFEQEDNTEDEVNADMQAVEWLSPYFEEKKLRELCNYWKEKK